MKQVIADLKKDQIKRLAQHGQREDDRKLDEFRNFTVERNPIGPAEGSARVKLGNTDIMVGVKMSVGAPYPDKPSQGVLITGTELKPMAHSSFNVGPPKAMSIEIARVVDRSIRESGSVDFTKLCIEPGEKVWVINLDIQVIDYDGNLFDAGTIGGFTALQGTVVPAKRFGVGEDHPLPVEETPVSTTFVKIDNNILLDPTLIEEQVADARLTVTTDTSGNIRAMQKGLSGAFSYEEITAVVDGSIEIGKKIRQKLRGPNEG